ncbi:MAG: large subunit ribosomal protein L3 [Candidatus Berkelbacteria bacterium Athens1014_28]|uniref:Large ribosomal subunit protein uL3 n=1 Tax=Candidatus Berkelbacteria bacterium Athens1014_28 TaxID=2017145 RepID=A0A554LQY9_9BACT|nr:MAG: large subunit ribosomal protein L3 [Candidatus Berkelbacteria bacterium Athens1014_28]
MKILIAQKLRMTRIFNAEGEEIAVTALKSKLTEVFKLKNSESDGYEAIKVKVANRKINKFTEFVGTSDLYTNISSLVDVDKFSIGDEIKIIGTSKGKGFSGTIKRYHFAQGPKSHGSNQQRRLGSIGAGYPQRVQKDQKMPGRMGGKQVTVKNLKIIDIDKEKQIILVSGAVPGPVGSQVKVIG